MSKQDTARLLAALFVLVVGFYTLASVLSLAGRMESAAHASRGAVFDRDGIADADPSR
jgi:hypothetical protein